MAKKNTAKGALKPSKTRKKQEVRLKSPPPNGAPKDHVIEAVFEAPESIRLRFADGLEGTWPLTMLEMDFSDMKLETFKAGPGQTSVHLESNDGEPVVLDAGAMRAVIDPSYQTELEAAYRAIIGPPKDLPVSQFRATS